VGGGAALKASPTDHAAGEMEGDRSRTDFSGASQRKAKRLAGDRGQDMPVSGLAPKPPPVMVLYEDLADQAQLVFDLQGARRRVRGVPVYGQYPRALIPTMLPWLGCARHEVLHVCSGSLPPGEGIRVDIRPTAQPDIIADGRKLPLPSGSVAAVMLDPPYSDHYAKELYGVQYPRPAQLLREAARVVRPGGRIVIVHYITPKPVRGTTFVKAFGLSTGFDMPMRAVTVFQRDGVVPPLFPEEVAESPPDTARSAR
jgi:SAM-dependent methyltransferase